MFSRQSLYNSLARTASSREESEMSEESTVDFFITK